MKALCFGNPRTEFLRFKRVDIAPDEGGIGAQAEFRIGWFVGLLPLFLRPEALERFLQELAKLDESLSGAATLFSEGTNGPVTIVLAGLPLGHIECSVEANLDGSTLKVSFRTDQTQLRPLYDWWSVIRSRYAAGLK